MPLQPGTRLGNYEVLSELGFGGMHVASDGRFLLVQPHWDERSELYDEVRIVLNWTHELDH